MIPGLNASELTELAVLLVLVGMLSGFLAGVFGIGGGAILVPVFYECFRLAGVPLEVRMPLCIGTSLAIIIPTSIRSCRAHYARGAVDMEILKALVAAGAGRRVRRQRHRALCAGAAVQDRVRGRGMVGRGTPAAGEESWNFGADFPKGMLMRGYGFMVGLLSTLMGVGGGLFSNLLMTFYNRTSIRRLRPPRRWRC